jgi:hypothetical protein
MLALTRRGPVKAIIQRERLADTSSMKQHNVD